MLATLPVPALARRSAAITGPDAMLSCALAASFDGLAALAADGSVVAANPPARDLLGLDDGLPATAPLWDACAGLRPDCREQLRALVSGRQAGSLTVQRAMAGAVECRWRPLAEPAATDIVGILGVRAASAPPVADVSPGGHPADDPETLRIMLDHLPGVLALKDAGSRRFVEVRGAEVVSPGSTSGSMVGKTAHEIYPAALAAEIDAVESEVLRRTGGVHETSFQIERDGRPQWFLSKKLTVADATGAARYLLTYNIEITAQIQAQRALDRTNAFLDAVIDYMPALVAVREMGTGRLVRVNREFGELLGRLAGEPAERALAHLPEAIAATLRADDARLQRSPETVAERVFTLGQGDGQRHFYSRSVVIPGDPSQPSFILSMQQDITERVAAERALAESRTFLSRILEHLPSALAVKDARTRRYLFFNDPAQAKLAGPGGGARIGIGRGAGGQYAPDDAAFLGSLDDTIVGQPDMVLEREIAQGQGSAAALVPRQEAGHTGRKRRLRLHPDDRRRHHRLAPHAGGAAP